MSARRLHVIEVTTFPAATPAGVVTRLTRHPRILAVDVIDANTRTAVVEVAMWADTATDAVLDMVRAIPGVATVMAVA